MLRVTAPIVSITSPTPRSRLLTFDVGGETFAFAAGQAVMVSFPADSEAKPYSIASSPEHVAATGRLELLIAVEQPDAPELHTAREGSQVEIEGPLGTFTLPDALAQSRLLFVAGGTGIAPLRSMLNHALRAFPGCRVSVLYSARRSDEFAFIDELREYEREHRIELHQTVTRDDSTTWQGRRGRIGRAHFEAVMHEPHETMCFVCGPPSMVEESVAMLRALGVPEPQIKTEQWGR